MAPSVNGTPARLSADGCTTEPGETTTALGSEAEISKHSFVEHCTIKVEDCDDGKSNVFQSEKWGSDYNWFPIQQTAERRTRSCAGKLGLTRPRSSSAQIISDSYRGGRVGWSRERRSSSKVVASRSTPDVSIDSDSDDGNKNGIFETPKRNGNNDYDQSTPLTPPSTHGSDSAFEASNKESPTRGRPMKASPVIFSTLYSEAGECGRHLETPIAVNNLVRRAEEVLERPLMTRGQYFVEAENQKGELCGSVFDGRDTSKLDDKVHNKDRDFGLMDSKAIPVLVRGIQLLNDICRCDILERVKAGDPQRCSGSKTRPVKKPKQCKKTVRYNDKDRAVECLERLHEPQDVASCFNDLKAVIELLFCSGWHFVPAADALGEWALLHRVVQPIEASSRSPHRVSQETTTINAGDAAPKLSTVEPKKCLSQDEIEALRRKWLLNFPIYNQSRYDFRQTEARQMARQKEILAMYFQKLLPYSTKASRCFNTSEYLREAIRAPLSRIRDRQEGFLYMYWFPSNFGNRKIGATSQNIEMRLKGWTKQCGHDAELIYPKEIPKRVVIPHVFRLERLVFAELKEFRHEEIGCRCGRAHREWVKLIDDNHVLKIIDRWTKWIMQNPYEERGKTWQLKEIHREQLDKLCVPMLISAE